MMKVFSSVVVIVALVGMVVPVYAAQPGFSPVTFVTPDGVHTLVLPEPAEGAHVVSLGSAVDPGTGKKVEGYAIIHYKEGHGHKPGHGNGGGGSGTSTCYSYLANGAKWKTVEPYLVDITNSVGLLVESGTTNGVTIHTVVAGGIAKWEDAADGTVGNGAGVDILGSEATGIVDGVDTSSPDDKNEVLFGSVSSPGAIAVTTVWGVFAGPPSQRRLVEWDQIYDTTDYDWSLRGEAGKMDFENIATHELGHSVGMGHPENMCTEETMYAYANYGEITKRDLHTGDIAGVNNLY